MSYPGQPFSFQLKFLLSVPNHSLYEFSDFLKKIFCHLSPACHSFCLQILYTLRASSTVNCLHLEEAEAHLASSGTHMHDFLDNFSGRATSIVLSVVATAVERVVKTGPVSPACTKMVLPLLVLETF